MLPFQMFQIYASLLTAVPDGDLENLLIPIIAIAGGLSIPVIAIFFHYRGQKLRAHLVEKAIEQGLTTEEIREILDGPNQEPAKQGRRRVPLRGGLILIAIGAAFWFNEHPYGMGGYTTVVNTGGAGNFVAILLVGLGLANIISDLFSWGRRDD